LDAALTGAPKEAPSVVDLDTEMAVRGVKGEKLATVKKSDE